MDKCEVLVLNGSPGSGKSTIANLIADHLRESDITHAVIDVDELARVFPEKHMAMMWDNLSLIWKNYCQVPDIKVTLPVCIDDKEAFEALRNATPCNRFTICELTAPVDVLKSRVANREPNKYWQEKLKKLVDAYKNRPVKFSDFQQDTSEFSPTETAKKITEQLGWL